MRFLWFNQSAKIRQIDEFRGGDGGLIASVLQDHLDHLSSGII